MVLTRKHSADSIASFLSAVERQIAAYQPVFAYIAAKTGTEFIVGQAAVRLNTGPAEIPVTHFASENLRAGQYTLDELQLSLEGVLASLLAGSIDTPAGKLVFPKSANGRHNASFEPFHPEGIQNQTRLSVLRLSGATQPLSQKRLTLDWELRAALPPYDNVQELMNEYSLGTLRDDAASIEFVAFNVAVVEFSSKVEGTKAYPRIRLANGLQTDKAALGFRIMNRGNLVRRGMIKGNEFTWESGDTFQSGTSEIDIPVSAALQCFVSYDGVAQHFGWLVDPSTVQNPRRAVYEAFDSELKILRDILAKANGRGPQVKEFEAGISWLLWMLGFGVAHLGGTPRTQEAADLIATSASGDFAVIECTTGLLKAENKMSLLVDRVHAVRRSLDTSENLSRRILPVMITSKTRAEVEPDLDQAAKLGILVITRESFEQALTRTAAFPDSNKILEDGFQAMQRP